MDISREKGLQGQSVARPIPYTTRGSNVFFFFLFAERHLTRVRLKDWPLG